MSSSFNTPSRKKSRKKSRTPPRATPRKKSGTPPRTPPRATSGIVPGTPGTPGTPEQKKHNSKQSDIDNLSDFGNNIDIFRTDNENEKVVERGICYFGLNKDSILSYLKRAKGKQLIVYKWTLPLSEVKLFDLTAEKNYTTLKDIRNALSDGEKNNFDECLIKSKDEKKFIRHSNNVDKDNDFFKMMKDKLDGFVGTYTKKQMDNDGHNHAEVVIWDEATLESIHNEEYAYEVVQIGVTAAAVGVKSKKQKRHIAVNTGHESPTIHKNKSQKTKKSQKSQKRKRRLSSSSSSGSFNSTPKKTKKKSRIPRTPKTPKTPGTSETSETSETPRTFGAVDFKGFNSP